MVRDRLFGPRPRSLHKHLDPDLIAVHAANELHPDEALEVTRVIATCDDGSCLALLRDAVASSSAAADFLYGVRREEYTDPSLGHPHKQTARTFECDDDAWDMFERIAKDEGCSIDWLLNEAMRAYAARQERKSWPGSPRAPRNIVVTPAPSEAGVSLQGGGGLVDRNTPTSQWAIAVSPAHFRMSSSRPPKSRPQMGSSGLWIVCGGRRRQVDKDRFVIGRGGPSSDLALDDPNVSRQHALIEYVQGAFYLVDMGSTNGIRYGGELVKRHLIEHGDVFTVCDHEIEFLFD